ncbi:type II toxin-antitoxin system Phd/YefM family antitoxin [Nocardia terpenica]|uniref:Antitoxin n=1 Tax=Nocardia terpenica TaxID=455432 RepID=A0A291RIE0_9NOCA|nr:type II toxin-antitoxin system prevent-host-death family antitoxin [Nocardia terpenica]ATL67090.1 prevent-host-death protein [Nocardia terpenica]
MHADEAHANFTAVLDAATEDNDEVIITRSDGKEAVVIISLRQWESIKETAHLLSNAANAAWLSKGIAQAESGQAQARELIDTDDHTESTSNGFQRSGSAAPTTAPGGD